MPTPPDNGQADETLDAFHRGAFFLVQPALKGHRAGVDAMILASAVPENFNGRLVDLGSGAGGAGLAAISRCRQARATLVERSDFMADYARRTLAHPANATIAARADFLQADVTLTGKARVAAGLVDNSADFAIMNPPFNLTRDRQTPDPVKAEAHVMHQGLFEQWIRTAAAIVRPGGGIAIIARPQSLQDLLAQLQGRFGALSIVPVHPRPQDPAIRIVVRGVRASRADMTLCPPLILHGETGNGFTARAEALNNGKTGLFQTQPAASA